MSIAEIAEVLSDPRMEDLRERLIEYDHARSRNRLAVAYSRQYQPGDDFEDRHPYKWAVEFHNHRATERAIIAGNQVGKSQTCAAEVAIHATGRYPSWWEGHRFNRPIIAIVAGETAEKVKKIQQNAILGEVVIAGATKTFDGTGWIPADSIGEADWRQTGTASTAGEVLIRHVSGGWSKILFLAYTVEAEGFQGYTVDLVWMDEEPKMDIFTEALTRILVRRGILILSRTPLYGASDVIMHFLDAKAGSGIWWLNVTWDDAPHLDDETKARMLLSFPEHERKTRMRGDPMMGSGLVYLVPEEDFIIAPLKIQPWWRVIAACDFGIGHPAAGCWIAHDPDTNTRYVFDSYKKEGETAIFHAHALSRNGKHIPIAYPHDGDNRERGSGDTIAQQYREAGASIMHESARIEDDKGGAQPRDAMTYQILKEMRLGQFKVFDTQTDLRRELRMLHRKDGVIVDVNDDIESAMRYARMMDRYAVAFGDGFREPERRGMAMANAPGIEYDPYSALRRAV